MPKAKVIPQNEGQVDQAKIKQRIIDILTVYTRASPTMLQGALGAYVKPADWRPVLDKMIAKGLIAHTIEFHNGKTYKVLELVH